MAIPQSRCSRDSSLYTREPFGGRIATGALRPRNDRGSLWRADDICPYEFYRTFVQHRRGGYNPPVVSLGAPIDPYEELRQGDGLE